MKRILLVLLSLAFISGCINKHPYKYVLNENLTNTAKPTSTWIIENIGNDTSMPMTSKKQSCLTNQIYDFLKKEGFNAQLFNLKTKQGDLENCEDCLVVKTKIIESMAQISNNKANWHGTSEDPLDFWSHFSTGGLQFVEGKTPALSLYVEVYVDGKKHYENAGGIELVGKYNKFSGRLRTKNEIALDGKKFQKAITIAFKPLIDRFK